MKEKKQEEKKYKWYCKNCIFKDGPKNKNKYFMFSKNLLEKLSLKINFKNKQKKYSKTPVSEWLSKGQTETLFQDICISTLEIKTYK